MTKKFLLWWLVLIIQLSVIAVSVFYDYHKFVLENDITYLSFLILMVWIVTTIYIGIRSRIPSYQYEIQWFSAEQCMTIGMIGTVIGFLLVLGGSFEHLDPGNTDQMREVITDMAIGLSVALLTTLNGLIASMFIKIQIVVVENDET